ncbi:transposase [Glycomyces artemisiae]|uniref:transposase n=1 Tax=Glycomyces artemisiae TaxID=1076443 RepID=UPI003CCBA16C
MCSFFDETGDLKKGRWSLGVARQYTGTAGRVENSQVSTWAGPLHGSLNQGHDCSERREDGEEGEAPGLPPVQVGACRSAVLQGPLRVGSDTLEADPPLWSTSCGISPRS